MRKRDSLPKILGHRRRLPLALIAVCATVLTLTLAPASVYAISLMSRGEMVTRAYSALGNKYAEAGQTHLKSYIPDVAADGPPSTHEPYIDCSGLLQKCWQVDDQKYPGEYPMGQEYKAQMFHDCGYPSLWYGITQSQLVMGDGLASLVHCVVYVGAVGGEWDIIEARGAAYGVVHRQWPSDYTKSSFQAIRRANIEGSYATDVIVDNPTARQRGGPVTYCHSCPYFWDWSKSTNAAGYKGIDYQYHAGTATGTEATVRYSPCLPATGYYNVYMMHPAYSTYGTAVQVKVWNANGCATYYVNETINGGTWQLLGMLYFTVGFHPSTASLTISTYGTPGAQHVVADAVKFILQ